MRVLIACEFSGVVRDAFRARGHDAWSCDLLPAMGEQRYHLCDDANLIAKHSRWDLIIAHPPCTWLCQAMRMNAARKDRPNITPIFEAEREQAYQFAIGFFEYAERVCVENPIGYLNQRFRKPEQVARPYLFGHPYNKDVCLWLKNLPTLAPTGFIPPPYKNSIFGQTSGILMDTA